MQDPAQLARFEREARAASALNHPNILTVYEIGSAHGRAYIATEYVEGKTLRARIAERNLSLEEMFNIAEQIGEALNAAHVAGLIHCDIKPQNIMLRPDGYVKVLDFGLAKLLKANTVSVPAGTVARQPTPEQPELARSATLAQSSLIFGTPMYMSPEQARGETLDGRSDLWSLGATLYEMLTGEALVDGVSVERAGGQAIGALKLNSEQQMFRPILQKAVATELDQRYQSARDFLVEVRRVRSTVVSGRPNPAAKRTRRRSIWIAGVAGALLLAASLIGVSWIGLMNRREEAPSEGTLRRAAAVAPTENSAGRLEGGPEFPAGKLYWELGETEKMTFLREAARNIATMLGDNPSGQPQFSSTERLAPIKKQLESYVAKRNSLSTTPGKESIKTVYARASIYAPFIIEAFRAHRLPPILGLYVAMNETDYHPCTESPVGAKGLFSFLPQTAQRYGLRLVPNDERCDPRRIAEAAARYLEDLTKRFGQDSDARTLALAAYNCGPGCVEQAQAELRAVNIQPVSVWVLLENQARLSTPLPRESRDYVPRFFATAIMGEAPQRFGLEIQRLSAYTTTR
ncbi:MAG TPA: protein kinase, partial [Blastocatellia bacterium]|nr:protein kinase [Blastocatellia bacterium]